MIDLRPDLFSATYVVGCHFLTSFFSAGALENEKKIESRCNDIHGFTTNEYKRKLYIMRCFCYQHDQIC